MRIVMRSFIFAACLILAFSILASCVSQDNAPAQALDEQLSVIAAVDMDEIEECFSAGLFSPEDYGVRSQTFAEKYFEGFTYEVGDASVNGNEASVQYTVSVKDISQVLDTLEAARDEALSDGANPADEGYADACFIDSCEQQPWDVREVSGSASMMCDERGVWSVADRGSLCATLLDGYDLRQVYS